MSISSDGQLCYGIAFEGDYTFPWLNKQYSNDYEDWWINKICGYKPLFKLYDSNGEYFDNISKEMIRKYYDHFDNFKKSNPMPVDIISHCSFECPMYIIAAKKTYSYSIRGIPTKIRLNDMNINDAAIIDFCERYCKPKNEYEHFPEMTPTWLLSSMYG